MTRSLLSRISPVLSICLLWAAATPARAQFGILLTGGGPVNRSFGGTATAAPLDALGALFWNPATLSGLKQSEVTFGAEILTAFPRISSSVQANAFGPGVPGRAMSGTTNSDSAGALLPNVGLAQRVEDSPLTFGLGLETAGGFATNYPASVTNPILTPQPPFGIGFGNLSAELQVYQLIPAVSYQVTGHLALGVAAIVDFATLRLDPLAAVAPDDANGDGFPTFPSGSHTPYEMGGGFQVGAYYTTDSCFNFGVSVKSPQWFEKVRVNSVNELGQPRSDRLSLELPMVVSAGISYTGFEHWLLASDFRYVDYRDASLFGGRGFTPQGAINGAGFDSIFVVTFGAQYEISERLSARVGYDFNTSPQSGAVAFIDAGAPVILQHTASTGLTWKATDNLLVSLSYLHSFENSVEGQYQLPQGYVPGTSVKSTVSVDGFAMGVTVRY